MYVPEAITVAPMNFARQRRRASRHLVNAILSRFFSLIKIKLYHKIKLDTSGPTGYVIQN